MRASSTDESGMTTDSIRVPICVYAIHPERTGAFATAQHDGRRVFISGKALDRIDMQPGSRFTARLIVNTHDRANCPWFAVWLDPAEDEALVSAEDVEADLRRFGVVTAEGAALRCGDGSPAAQAEAEALLEGLYRARKAVKIVLFASADREGSKVWYGADVEAVQVTGRMK